MRDFDQSNIAGAVIKSFGKTPHVRLKRIMTSLADHFHRFIGEVELTLEEWAFAIEFLTLALVVIAAFFEPKPREGKPLFTHERAGA